MKLLFGCGYLGLRTARRWLAEGSPVTVVTRNRAKADALVREGFAAIIADVCRPETLVSLPPAETVVFAVGYDRRAPSISETSGPTIHDVYAGGLRNVLQALITTFSPSFPHPSPLFTYVSSTGVYGDFCGAWVDESRPTDPQREGGRACLAAETVLAEHPLGRRAVVLRMAGLYGPQRIPRSDALRRGEPIDAPADGYLNLIHVDDAAQIVLDVERRALTGEINLPRTYCVADGRPDRRGDYYAELARLLDAPPPQFVAPSPTSPGTRRAAADKRVCNARLLREIAPTLVYPSFREGLAAITAAEQQRRR